MINLAPTRDEIDSAVALLWEIAEGEYDPADTLHLRRVARLLERQQAEIERLRKFEPKVAA